MAYQLGAVQSVGMLSFGAPPNVGVSGLVPKFLVKLGLASEYLDCSSEAAKLVEVAETFVVVGYSFADTDDQFNDSVRTRVSRAEIMASLLSPKKNRSEFYGL